MVADSPTHVVLPAVQRAIPLCVDLDGTLVQTDTLYECLLLLLAKNPFYLFLLPLWLWRGKAFLKQEICRRVDLDVERLPYHPELVARLQEEHRAGRPILLVTAADQSIARKVADHLGLFSGVCASDGATNLSGARKLELLVRQFGVRGFDYAGNARPDLHIWREANKAIVVCAGARLTRKAQSVSCVECVMEVPSRPWRDLRAALRVHQWVKNILIFVPLLTSHQLFDLVPLTSALGAFIAFSLCASGVYVLNDCIDLQTDRRHDKKRHRPFAAGKLSLPFAFLLLIALTGGAAAISLRLPHVFQFTIALYFGLTLAYSFYFNLKLLLDVFFLGGLYTIRVLAGNAATGIAFSPWLLAFSMFLFISLAFVKRVAEVDKHGQQDLLTTSGRGYRAIDKQTLVSLGTTSGQLCVLVLALSISSPQVELLYRTPILLWLLCPLVMYWVSRVWIITCRGRMDDDPVVFALRDGVSYIVGLCAAAVIVAATVAWEL